MRSITIVSGKTKTKYEGVNLDYSTAEFIFMYLEDNELCSFALEDDSKATLETVDKLIAEMSAGQIQKLGVFKKQS